MKERTYSVNFRQRDIAYTPPCGMDAAIKLIDEMIRSILSRYADETGDNKLRFGHSGVEIKNGFVKIYQDSGGDTEKIISILRDYFSVREITE